MIKDNIKEKKTKTPQITVLMSVYNGEKFLEDAIDSILSQTFDDFELLIIDDGSTDRSTEIISGYSDSRIYLEKNKQNIGLTKSLNKGIRLAKSKFIARMDADDICVQDRLEKQIEFLKKNPNIAVVGGWVSIFGSENEMIWRTPTEHSTIESTLLFQNALFHPTVMFRKDKLLSNEQNVLYNEDFRVAQDYDLWAYLAKQKFRLANIPEVLVYRRLHKGRIGFENSHSQLDAANLIRKRLLSELGITVNDDQFLLHYLIASQQAPISISQFLQIDNWLVKLNLANQDRLRYHILKFNEVLTTKWLKLFNGLNISNLEKISVLNSAKFLKDNYNLKYILKKSVMPKPIVSVVVCSYNREDLLAGALQSLVEQNADKNTFEVIVVDNNSTDSTPDIAKRFSKSYQNLRIISEPEQGLSHARNRGFKESRGEYVAYIDDDAIAPTEWVPKMLEIIEKFSPDIFGGPIYPFYTNKKPLWFKDEYEIRKHTDKTGWMSGSHLSGSNFIVKKSVLTSLGGFDTAAGMKGSKIAYGEEVGLIERAYSQNFKLYYHLDLIVKHHVPEFKQTLGYFLFRTYKAGKDAKYIYDSSFSFEQMQRLVFKVDNILLDIEKGLKTRNKDKYSYPENYIIEEIVPKLHYVGQLNEFTINKTRFNISEIFDFYQDKIDRLGIKDFIKIQIKLFKMLLK